jgi:hypothetical protein
MEKTPTGVNDFAGTHSFLNIPTKFMWNGYTAAPSF